MKHLPNTLTVVRIALTPVVLFLLFQPGLAARIWALALFVLASISDYLDGKAARHFDVGSRLGQLLDPLADKVLVLGTFAGLAILLPETVSWWGVALIALRDLAVTGLRTREARRGRLLKTSWAAKTKTTVQLTFLILLLVLRVTILITPLAAVTGVLFDTGAIRIFFWVVVAVTVWTGIAYFRAPAYDAS